ncbi:MAG: hypothetical protein K2F59_01810, partial [Eubacteriales bacterium]|nr:hypothetical protein [Eubacteriales bacterium]
GGRGEEFYEKYKNEFLNIINNPDIVFEDNKNKNTLLVCKEVLNDNNKVCIVLRLVLSDDNPNFKNSIITAHSVDEKKIKRWENKKNILYKK